MRRWLWVVVVVVMVGGGVGAQGDDALSIGSPRAIDWSPDGRYIAIAGGDPSCTIEPSDEFGIVIIDATTLEFVRLLTGENSCPIRDVAWSPDSQQIAASPALTGTQIWNADTGELFVTGPSGSQEGISGVIWSPDGGAIANVLANSFLFEVWNTTSGEGIRYFGLDPVFQSSIVSGIVWNPTEDTIISGGRNDFNSDEGYLRIWDAVTGELLVEIDDITAVVSISLSPDNTRFATSNRNDMIQIRDAANAELLTEFPHPRSRIAWHPQDELLVAGRIGDGSVVTVLDISTGATIAQYDTTSGAPKAVWSPFGGRLVFNSADRLTIDTTTRSRFDGIALVVPDPTLDRLNAIADLCVPADISLSLPTTPDAIPDFVAQVESLPEGVIPPACAADLLAVAGAIGAAP